jgi:hypothetical protein
MAVRALLHVYRHCVIREGKGNMMMVIIIILIEYNNNYNTC